MAIVENSLESLQHHPDSDTSGIKFDRELLKAALVGHGENLKYCPFEYTNDKELVSLAVRNNRFEIALAYASEEMQDNEEIVEESMKGIPSSFRFASERLKNQKEFAFKAISYLPANIFYLSERLQNDLEIIEKALELDGELILSLQYRKDEIIRNKEILFKAIKSCSSFCRRYIFKYLARINSELLQDQQLLQKFILPTKGFNGSILDDGEENGKMVMESDYLQITEELIMSQLRLFRYAPLKFRSDIELVKRVVSKRGDLLEFVDEPLKDDYNVVLEAVCAPGNALRFASERLRDNTSLCLSAVKGNKNQFIYVSERLRSNRSFILKCLSVSDFMWRNASAPIFENISENLQTDLNFVKQAFQANCSITNCITVIDEELLQMILKNNVFYLLPTSVRIHEYKDQVIEYLKEHECSAVLKHFPDDKELALRYIKDYPYLFSYLSPSLKNDEQILAKLENSSYYKFLIRKKEGDSNNLAYREQALIAVRNGGSHNIPDEFKDDREIVMEALNFNYYFSLNDVSLNLRKDLQIVLKAIEKDPQNLFYADMVFRSDKSFILKLFDENRISDLSGLDVYLRDDIEIATKFLKKCPSNFMYLSERLRNDPSFAIPFLIDRPMYLSYSSLSGDKQLMMKIIENSSYFYSIPLELCKDADVIRALFSKYRSEAVEYCKLNLFPYSEWTKHKDLVKMILKDYPDAYYQAIPEIQNDEEVRKIFSKEKSKTALIMIQK